MFLLLTLSWCMPNSVSDYIGDEMKLDPSMIIRVEVVCWVHINPDIIKV